jgi:hypothetical protein
LESLIKGYAILFGVKDEESNEDSSEGSPEFVKHWGWYYTLDSLSNNDRTKWDFFLDMNVVAFLNTLAYFKDKQEYIAESQKKQRNGY